MRIAKSPTIMKSKMLTACLSKKVSTKQAGFTLVPG